MSRTTASALAITVSLTFHLSAAQVPDAAAEDAIDRFLARPVLRHQYTAMRRLEATGSGQRGWLDAKTEFTPAEGLRYEVTAEGGSGFIRSRVLRSLLEEERQLIARGGSDGVEVAPANYRFESQAVDADGLTRVAIEPLRKEKSLIRGHMFLAPDGELVRIDGRLARNPSFWITGVHVVRSYRRINGVLLPVALESTAQLRLLGRSTLRMTYHYSAVDERPADDSGENNQAGRP